MTVLDPVTTPGQPIRAHLRSVGTTRKRIVGAYCAAGCRTPSP